MYKSVTAIPLALLTVVFAVDAAADQGPYPETQEALNAEFAKLKWIEEPGTYDLPRSNSKVSFAAGRSMLIGADAQRILFLWNGREFPASEAVLYDDANDVFVVFAYIDEGYVTDEDWSDVDPAAFLESIRKGTEAGNEDRAKYGIPAMHVRGWLSKPEYNADSHIATWAIESDVEDGVTVNATALKLSRHGYEKLTWVGSGEQYKELGGFLDTAVADHAFDEGHRYADFKDGDKVAAYGLAALVAAVAGAKLGKGIIATIIAFGLVFLKKGGIIVAVALGGIWAAIKRVFGGKGEAPSGGR